MLFAEAIDECLYCGVEQFDDEDLKERGDHEGALYTGVAEPHGDRDQDSAEQQFLPEGDLAAEGVAETGDGLASRPEDAERVERASKHVDCRVPARLARWEAVRDAETGALALMDCGA